MTKPRAWTKQQTTAIRTTGKSLLVSAGAGSGKTAVLSERCAYLVAEAAPTCSIDQLLVVTFTDAAAAEMRQRIAAALRARLDARPHNRHLAEQIALVSAAPISTLHSFCRRLLQRFFALLDLDPGFRVLDEHDAAMLRRDALDSLFAELHAGRGDLAQRFDAFIEESGRGRDAAIRETIDNLDKFLASTIDPDAWLNAQLARFQHADAATLAPAWSQLRNDALIRELDSQIGHTNAEIARLTAADLPLLQHFVKPLNDYLAKLAAWHAAATRDPSASSIDTICADITAFELPRTPPKSLKAYKDAASEDKTAFDRAQLACKFIKEKLFDAALRTEHALFSAAQWADGIARVAPHVATVVDLLRAFQKRYESAKRQQIAVDFADLERLALRLLRDPANPDKRTPGADWLAAQYEHLLVDEFQDINPVQDDILRRVSRLSPTGRPTNLFAVGDVKQSIYRFRLAETGVFLERQRTALDAAHADTDQHVPLNLNFRSTKPLLDFVNAVFLRLMAQDLGGIDYDANARLNPGTDEQKIVAGPAVELHILEDAPSRSESHDDDSTDDSAASDWERIEREAYFIAERIKQLTTATPPVAYGDIVILMRSPRRQAPLLVRALERRSIPVVAELAGGFFDALELQDVLATLALLDNSQQDIPLAAFLRGPLAPHTFTDADLVAIRAFAGHDVPFAAAVAHYARNGPDATRRDRVQASLQFLVRWRREFRRRPLPDALADLLALTGFSAHTAARPEAAQRLANLTRLHDYAREFSTFSRHGLYRFLRFLDDLRDQEGDPGAAPAAIGTADVVRVMSIHRAKGLEFPVVFVCELGKLLNLQDARKSILFDRNLGIGLDAVDLDQRIIYHTLPQRLVAREVQRQSLAEELRVLYVALTRPKTRLILVGSASLDTVADARAAAEPSAQPLPLRRRLAARRYIDWLLPAIAAMPPESVAWPAQPATTATLVTIHEIPISQMRDWQLAQTYEPGVRERLRALAHLEEIPGELQPLAGPAGDAAALLARLAAQYPHAPLTRTPAVISASALKRPFDSIALDEDPTARQFVFSVELPRPSFLAGGAEADGPTQRGTRTHRFLQHLDLAAPLDPAGVRAQAENFVATGRLTADESRELDFDAVAWFFTTPLGQRMIRARQSVRREIPFVVGLDPATYNTESRAAAPDDRLLVRGMIDCFFEDAAGCILLDYKTDAIKPEQIPARTELYAPQLRIYATALESIWKVRVTERALVYLSPRVVESLAAR